MLPEIVRISRAVDALFLTQADPQNEVRQTTATATPSEG